jgi:hypothetical protein
MIRRNLPRFFVLAFLLLVARAPVSLGAAPLPGLPCGSPSYPAIPALDAPPNVAFWTGANLSKEWVPNACSGWQTGATAFVVAVAGHFSSLNDVRAMLMHIGRISALPEVRYWSVTDKRWEALFGKAASLTGPGAAKPRSDFSAAEFQRGIELYFLSTDNRTLKDMVMRLRAKEIGPDRIVLETTNVSPMRWLAFTVVPAGDMQTLYFLDREPAGTWQFYSMTRVLNASLFLSRLVSGASYVNRAVAMYRHIAGIPTDRDPPAMP